MRFGDHRTSDNVESQRGQRFGGGGLGGGAGMLIGLVGSRFGIVGIIVVVGLLWLFGGLGNLTGGGQQAVSPVGQGQPGASAQQTCQSEEVTRFACQCSPPPSSAGPSCSPRPARATRRPDGPLQRRRHRPARSADSARARSIARPIGASFSTPISSASSSGVSRRREISPRPM